MNKLRKFFRPSLKKLGVLLMIAGFAVIMYVPSTWALGWWERRSLASDFEQQSAATMAVNQSILDKLQGAAETEKLKQLAMAFKANLYAEQTIAQLEIPRIGLNYIVVEGTEDGSLMKGPGHVEETPIPGMQGNFSIAGDRVLYGGPFLNLDEIEPGDEIFVRTTYGKFAYTVTSKSITDPEDVSILRSDGKEVITLITCDPPWDTSHRLIIRGTVTSASLL
jgi:sortase A